MARQSVVRKVRALVADAMGGVRGRQNAAAWVVAGTAAYFLWIKPERDAAAEVTEMEFCPTCANLLMVEHGTVGRFLRFFCPTCPYIYSIDRKISKKVKLAQKDVDDVLGGEEAWKNVDRTEATCPQCSHNQAYFMQIQIRSADEPMSTFYKCCNITCKFQWRDG